MTKSELLAEIDSNVTWRGTPELVDTTEEVNTYDCPVVVQLENGTYQKRTQPFYVQNEGQADETAVYARQQHVDWTEDPFRANVRSAVDTYIGNNADALKATIDQVNTGEHFAVVTLYRDDGSGNVVSEQRFVEGGSDDTITDHYPMA